MGETIAFGSIERHGGMLHVHVHVPGGDWARVVLDLAPRRMNGGAGAMIAICSSFGTYGLVFSAPGDDFVAFLRGCDVDYLSRALRPVGKTPTRDQARELAGFFRTMWPTIRSVLAGPQEADNG